MFVLRLPARVPLRSITSLLLGVLHAAAFRSDTGWPVEVAALAGLFSLVEARSDWRAATGLGFAFGLGWFLTGIYWIFISIHTYGMVSAPLAALATFLLCAYLSLYPALACGLASFWATRRSRYCPALLVLAPLWMLTEVARGTVLTGFPWMGTGYAHVGGPLAGYAPVLGVYGTTLAAGLLAAVMVHLTQLRAGRSLRQSLAWFALAAALPGLGWALSTISWSKADGPAISVRLLQGDIAQEVKFDPAMFDTTTATYLRLIEQKPADLIVLPETVVPLFFNDMPDTLIERLQHDASRLHAAIALGVPIADSATVYTNSVVAFSADATHLQRYDKSHLVPFGEFVPFGFRWFVDLMKIPLGDFTAGKLDQEPLTLAGTRVAFNICYEDLFGETIIRQAKNATLLVNVSNVAWFGDSQALPQHLQLSRMRAIETARPMLRATNTGMTAFLNAKGAVVAVLPPYTVGSLDVTVQPLAGVTPYVALGDTPAVILGLLLLLAAAIRSRKPRQ